MCFEILMVIVTMPCKSMNKKTPQALQESSKVKFILELLFLTVIC